MKTNYEHIRHQKFKIRYHIIFSTKYRKNFLTGQIAEDIKQSMIRASEGQLWGIELQEIDTAKPNHIHLLIRSTPSVAPYEIVHRLKQYSTYDLWQKHHSEMTKWYWSGKHYCWTRGYFCTSIGDACISTIEDYIEKQG